jgi:hypothetical protein
MKTYCNDEKVEIGNSSKLFEEVEEKEVVDCVLGAADVITREFHLKA